jgi:hypothetical protein
VSVGGPELAVFNNTKALTYYSQDTGIAIRLRNCHYEIPSDSQVRGKSAKQGQSFEPWNIIKGFRENHQIVQPRALELHHVSLLKGNSFGSKTPGRLNRFL